MFRLIPLRFKTLPRSLPNALLALAISSKIVHLQSLIIHLDGWLRDCLFHTCHRVKRSHNIPYAKRRGYFMFRLDFGK